MCLNYSFDVPAIHSSSTRGQPESDKEQREQHGRRQRDKDHRGKDEERKRQRHHYEFEKFMRRKDETKWGKGYCQERAKKEGHHHGYSYCPDGRDELGKEDRDDLSNRKERLRNKVSEKVSMKSVGGDDCTRRMSQFTNLLSNISVLVFIHITKSAFLSNPACTVAQV